MATKAGGIMSSSKSGEGEEEADSRLFLIDEFSHLILELKSGEMEEDNIEHDVGLFSRKVTDHHKKMTGGKTDRSLLKNWRTQLLSMCVIGSNISVDIQLAFGSDYQKVMNYLTSLYLDTNLIISKSKAKSRKPLSPEMVLFSTIKSIKVMLSNNPGEVWSVLSMSKEMITNPSSLEAFIKLFLSKPLSTSSQSNNFKPIDTSNTSSYTPEQYMRMVNVVRVFDLQSDQFRSKFATIIMGVKIPFEIKDYLSHHFECYKFAEEGTRESIKIKLFSNFDGHEKFLKELKQRIATEDVDSIINFDANVRLSTSSQRSNEGVELVKEILKQCGEVKVREVPIHEQNGSSLRRDNSKDESDQEPVEDEPKKSAKDDDVNDDAGGDKFDKVLKKTSPKKSPSKSKTTIVPVFDSQDEDVEGKDDEQEEEDVSSKRQTRGNKTPLVESLEYVEENDETRNGNYVRDDDVDSLTQFYARQRKKEEEEERRLSGGKKKKYASDLDWQASQDSRVRSPVQRCFSQKPPPYDPDDDSDEEEEEDDVTKSASQESKASSKGKGKKQEQPEFTDEEDDNASKSSKGSDQVKVSKPASPKKSPGRPKKNVGKRTPSGKKVTSSRLDDSDKEDVDSDEELSQKEKEKKKLIAEVKKNVCKRKVKKSDSEEEEEKEEPKKIVSPRKSGPKSWKKQKLGSQDSDDSSVQVVDDKSKKSDAIEGKKKSKFNASDSDEDDKKTDDKKKKKKPIFNHSDSEDDKPKRTSLPLKRGASKKMFDEPYDSDANSKSSKLSRNSTASSSKNKERKDTVFHTDSDSDSEFDILERLKKPLPETKKKGKPGGPLSFRKKKEEEEKKKVEEEEEAKKSSQTSSNGNKKGKKGSASAKKKKRGTYFSESEGESADDKDSDSDESSKKKKSDSDEEDAFTAATQIYKPPEDKGKKSSKKTKDSDEEDDPFTAATQIYKPPEEKGKKSKKKKDESDDEEEEDPFTAATQLYKPPETKKSTKKGSSDTFESPLIDCWAGKKIVLTRIEDEKMYWRKSSGSYEHLMGHW